MFHFDVLHALSVLMTQRVDTIRYRYSSKPSLISIIVQLGCSLSGYYIINGQRRQHQTQGVSLFLVPDHYVDASCV